MRVHIEFDCDTEAFKYLHDEIIYVCTKAARKIERQTLRSDGCICTAPEEDDLLRDRHGNIIGSVRVEKRPEMTKHNVVEAIMNLLPPGDEE